MGNERAENLAQKRRRDRLQNGGIRPPDNHLMQPLMGKSIDLDQSFGLARNWKCRVDVVFCLNSWGALSH